FRRAHPTHNAARRSNGRFDGTRRRRDAPSSGQVPPSPRPRSLDEALLLIPPSRLGDTVRHIDAVLEAQDVPRLAGIETHRPGEKVHTPSKQDRLHIGQVAGHFGGRAEPADQCSGERYFGVGYAELLRNRCDEILEQNRPSPRNDEYFADGFIRLRGQLKRLAYIVDIDQMLERMARSDDDSTLHHTIELRLTFIPRAIHLRRTDHRH